MTTSVNKTLTQAEKLFKDLVWTPMVDGAIASLFAASPFLAMPIISTLVRGTINGTANYLFSFLTLISDVTALSLMNASHQAAYVSASQKLAVIAHDSGINSPAFMKARDDAKAAMAQFTHFNA